MYMAQGHTQPLSWLRPVGWSGDGGVQESNKVELIKSGGGGGGGGGGGRSPPSQLGGVGERCKLPHWGLGQSPSRFATFAIFKPQNIAYCIETC